MNKIDRNTTNSEHELKYYMLHYKLVPDILTARIPYKEEHITLLNEFVAKGLVFAGGEVRVVKS